jgi:hypothetical protein
MEHTAQVAATLLQGQQSMPGPNEEDERDYLHDDDEIADQVLMDKQQLQPEKHPIEVPPPAKKVESQLPNLTMQLSRQVRKSRMFLLCA